MQALEGIKVLDVASMLAGPYGATLLGDLGADVIKLEPPTGEETRRMGPRKGIESGVFVGVNRNKRGIAVDLRTDSGRRVLDRLVRWADVIVDNYRPRAKQKLGLDFETMSRTNERIVSLSVSTYGATGPYAGRPGIDPIAQAMSGFMNVTGEEGRGPLKAGPPVGDAVTSLLVAYGAMIGLWTRERTGQGQEIHVALIDGLIHIQAAYNGQYFVTGRVQPRMGNSIDWYAPYNSFECRDGKHLQLACYNDKFFENLCAAIERADLLEDARFADGESRLKNRQKLEAEIAKYFDLHDRAHALNVLGEHDVIAGPINDYGETFSDPQVLHNQMVHKLEHATLGTVRVTGVPIHCSMTPGSVRRAPPTLGQHTKEVLSELGIDEADIREISGA